MTADGSTREAINAALRELEGTYVETGEMLEPDVGDDGGQGPDTEFEGEGPGAPGRDGSQAPF